MFRLTTLMSLNLGTVMNNQSTVIMNTNRYVLTSALLIGLAISSIGIGVSQAATGEHAQELHTEDPTLSHSSLAVKWGEYKSFTDVKSALGSRQSFAENTFNKLETYLHKLAADLPEGHTLELEVTNLDLAGRVLPGSFTGLGLHSTDMIRVIKSIDIPRIEFNYIYKDANGDILKSDTVNLKDMSFMTGYNPLFSSDSLKYEKNMLRKWFKSTIAAS